MPGLRHPLAPRHAALAIFVAVAVIFILAPLVIVVLNSFSSVAYDVFPPPGLSLRWYRNLAAQTEFYGAAWRSVLLALAVMALALVLGTLTAFALVRYRIPGAAIIRAMILSPMVVPQIVLGVAVFIFFVRIGMLGNVSNLLFTHTLVSVPLVVAIMSAALQNFDWAQLEAAADLGARPLRIFIKVVLPQVSAGVFFAGLLAFIFSFDQVETTLFLVRPGGTTLPIEMFLYLQRAQDPTIAALSSLLILFSAALLVLAALVFRRRKLPFAQGR